MENPTKSGTSTYLPTIDWAEPNLSFNQSPPHHIPSMNVGSHGINQEKPNQGFHRSNHLNPQPVIPPHGWKSNTKNIDIYPSYVGLQELKSTHNLPGL